MRNYIDNSWNSTTERKLLRKINDTYNDKKDLFFFSKVCFFEACYNKHVCSIICKSAYA